MNTIPCYIRDFNIHRFWYSLVEGAGTNLMISVHNNIHELYGYIKSKSTDPKEYKLDVSLYMKFKNRQSYCVVIDVELLVSFVGIVFDLEGTEGNLLGC